MFNFRQESTRIMHKYLAALSVVRGLPALTFEKMSETIAGDVEWRGRNQSRNMSAETYEACVRWIRIGEPMQKLTPSSQCRHQQEVPTTCFTL
jgi:hypothetical protein